MAATRKEKAIVSVFYNHKIQMNKLKNELEDQEKDTSNCCEDVFMTEAPTQNAASDSHRTLSNSKSNA